MQALYHESLLSSTARSFLDAYKERVHRPVSEVADIETWLGLGGLYVDPVFQHSRRHYVGSSVDFVEDALEHVGPLQKAGAQRFIVDARAHTRHFRRLSSAAAHRRKTLQGRTSGDGRRRSELVCRFSRCQECVPYDADSLVFEGVFRVARMSRIQSWVHSKHDRSKTSCSRMCSSWAMFFCQDVMGSQESADSTLFVCRDHSTPPLLACKHGGFRWSYAVNLGVVARGANNHNNVHLACLVAGVKGTASMCTTFPLPAGVKMFSAVKCLRPTRIAVERAVG